MIFKLQDRPLAVQIWIILGIIMGVFFALLSLAVPMVLNDSFTKETYARLEDTQEYIIKYQSDGIVWNREKSPILYLEKGERYDQPPPFRVVEHIFLNKNGEIRYMIGRERSSANFLAEITSNAQNQRPEIYRYMKKFDDRTYFYVIRKLNLEDDRQGYLVSYLKGDYRDNLVKVIFKRLIGTIVVVLLISWIASIFIARYLTRPLAKLKSRVKEIAQKNWNTSVVLERNDEIGQLSETIDWMRKQLVEQNRKQQEFLQQVSHELKTPVMVVKSYVQSIRDGIFPKGDLESSLETIGEEALQLEQKVRSLLNLTKLDYFSFQRVEKRPVNLADIIEKKVEIFGWRNSQLDWELKLEPLVINIDRGKFAVAVENLLDNQIRYAKERVEIKLIKQENAVGSSVLFQVWNDGPAISPEIMDDLFEKYRKGSDGDFGLGLALVKVIVGLHQGEIWAVNEKDGVSFYIRLPFVDQVD